MSAVLHKIFDCARWSKGVFTGTLLFGKMMLHWESAPHTNTSQNRDWDGPGCANGGGTKSLEDRLQTPPPCLQRKNCKNTPVPTVWVITMSLLEELAIIFGPRVSILFPPH